MEQLSSLLDAYGYRVESGRERVVFEDVGALAHVTQKIVGGRAQAITAEDILGNQPNFVVVEDNPPQGQLDRLITVSQGTSSSPQVISFSRFVDRIWRADVAAQWARHDSEAGEDTSLPAGMARAARPNPMDLYADQRLRVEDGQVRKALNHALDWLAQDNGGFLVILAEAGLGKSEFTRVLQWRAATDYANQSPKKSAARLPSVLLRVRLRDLDALTLDAISAYLRLTVGLDRIPNAEVLAHLISYRRVTLLLDGLDELDVPRSEIIYGLDELKQVVSDSGQILLTSRSGFARTEAPIRTALPGASVGIIEPLDEDGAIEMLNKYGTPLVEARGIYRSLPEIIRGVPLFLLWGKLSGYHGAAGKSRAETLLDMIMQFCERDEARLLLPADEQMKLLGEIAYYSMSGPISADDAAILCGDEDSRFVQGPHALLQMDPARKLHFRYVPFSELFLAQSIRRNWQAAEGGDLARFRSWLQTRMGERQLQDLTCEYLADLLPERAITDAWHVASQAPQRHEPWLRRNLLSVALQAIGDSPGEKDPVHRAERLVGLLGNKDLEGCILSGLTFEMLDFGGWDLRNIGANGASFAFCKFEDAELDERLQSAELSSCSGLQVRRPKQEIMKRGRRTLQRALRPFQNRAVSDHALHPRIAEDTPGLDRNTMEVLRRRRFVSREQREHGKFAVVLTDVGKLELQRFLSNPDTELSAELADVLHELGE